LPFRATHPTIDSNKESPMITGLHHTGIVVDDLDVMVRFYTEELGLSVLLELHSVAPPEGNHTGIPNARRKLVFLGWTESQHQIELVRYLDPPAPDGHVDKHRLGAGHICFNVSDIRQVYDTLKAKGVRFVTEPKFSDSPNGPIGVVYAQDPESNWLELIQWPSGAGS